MNFLLSICLLVALIGHSIFISLGDDKKSTLSEIKKQENIESLEKFKEIDFYQTKNNLPEFNVKSKEITHKDKKNGVFSRPEVTFFKEGKEIKLRAKSGDFVFDEITLVNLNQEVEVYSDDYNLRSEFATYNSDKKNVFVKGDVKTNYKDYFLDCDEGTYNLETQKFIGKGNIQSKGKHELSGDKIKIYSDYVEAYPSKKKSIVKGNVRGEIVRRRRYEGKMKFSADEIKADLYEDKLEMNGNVNLKRNEMSVNANQSKVYVQNFNKKLKYYELTGNVVINQKLLNPKTMNKYSRTAYAEKVEGFARQRKIILTGSPRVESKNNLIKGSKILIKENANLVEVLDTSANIDLTEGDL